MKMRALTRRTCGLSAFRLLLASRSVSSFDDAGRVLREEERSRENVYIKKREAELLDRLKKQQYHLDEIRRAFQVYKEEHANLEKWIDASKL